MEKKRGWLLGIIAGFINGLLGSGGGTLLVPFMERKLDVEEHKAHATAIAIILPLSAFSSIFYISNGMTDFKLLLWIAAGGLIGGFLGAKLLSKISSRWLHIIFGAFMIISAVRLVF